MRVAMRKRLWQHCTASHLAALDAWKTWQDIIIVVGDFTLYSFKKKRIPGDYKSFIYAALLTSPRFYSNAGS